MKLYSIQKQEYPGKPVDYAMHFQTSDPSHPYVMIMISEAQYNSMLDLTNFVSSTETSKYAVVTYF